MTKRKKKNNKTGKVKRNLREEIFTALEFQSGKAMNYKQISSILGIRDAALRMLIQEILKDEANKGNLVETERGKFKSKKVRKSIIEGIIQINRHGRGFVIVDGMDDDIEVPRGAVGTALWGDRVEVSYHPNSRKPSAKVINIVERARSKYVGIIQMSRNYAFCVPSEARVHVDFFIPMAEIKGAKDGDKVIVEMTKWDDYEDNPSGKVIQVLGRPGDNDVEMHAIMVEYGLPYEFDPIVEKAAEDIPQEITEKEIKARKDFRKTLTFTIDPHDAKDFDDALSLKKLENGNYEIGVHIADVSHYMPEGSILDDEAQNRATSVYLVDRTVPMLPEVLSNNLCSLRPNEDKLCFSAVFELDEQAKLKNEWFGRTVIHSDRRFTYDEAQQRIETGKGDLAGEVNLLNKLARVIRKKRFESGAIDFHSEEVKFNLDENGKPLSVFVKEMKEANQLIEEFMLLANKRVAKFIGGVGEGAKTFVYRIHDDPNPEKLKILQEFVRRFGYKIPKPTTENAGHVLRSLLKEIKGADGEQLIQTMAIRSMAKAAYSTENIGHFGLAFPFYSHFTSPIRRYPDVMVHRLLARYLKGGSSVSDKPVEKLCSHSSTMEKKAQDAEWASIKYKQVEFMHDRIGETFEGIISGMARWGIFVEVTETKCEGMVKMETLGNEYFNFDPDRYIVHGSKSGTEYHLGDKVRIKVVGADMATRKLDYELAD